MEKFTFEQLPEAVALLLEKMDRIEKLLENMVEERPETVTMLNISQAAGLLQVSVASLYTRVSRRQIPVHKPGKKLYFNKQELLEWMMSGRLKTNEEVQTEANAYLRNRSVKRPARRS